MMPNVWRTPDPPWDAAPSAANLLSDPYDAGRCETALEAGPQGDGRPTGRWLGWQCWAHGPWSSTVEIDD